MFKRIVWATDGSVSTAQHLPVVRELANDGGATVVVAHVQENLTIGRHPVFVDDHRALDAALQSIVDDLNANGVTAELALTESTGQHAGEAVAGLAHQAGADLIVTGSHGQGPVAGFFKGGFTIHLLKYATCPVLVIPRGSPEDN